jgi:hypothetical protein
MTSSTSIDEIKAAIERLSYEDQMQLASWLYAWTSVQRDRMDARLPSTREMAPFASTYIHPDQDIDDYRL